MEFFTLVGWYFVGTRQVAAKLFFALAWFSVISLWARAYAGDDATSLRLQVEELERARRAQERRIQELKLEELDTQRPLQDNAAQQALDRALQETIPTSPSILGSSSAPAPTGSWVGPSVRLLDLSLDALVAAGSSTATDEDLEGRLQGGAHDPIRRGFTLQQAEISLVGAVDPYFRGEAHVTASTSEIDLEEAFLTTTSLPYGLQLEAGHMLTEYGLLNPLHPHAWDWIDQPVVITRLLGGEGLRSPGLRLGWLTPLPWFSQLHFGAQNANEGETTASFQAEETIGGRLARHRTIKTLRDVIYLGRWENFWNLTTATGLKVGANLLHGPNSTGSDAETWIYGLDVKLRWVREQNFRGWPFFLWQTEVHKRDYTASGYWETQGDSQQTEGDPIEPEVGMLGSQNTQLEEPTNAVHVPGTILRDVGFYSQLLYGFRYGWAAGFRVEYASGKGSDFLARREDPLRSDRWRLSPLLIWHPTEYSRLRLQYNYDRVTFLADRNVHTVWVSAEILYGRHPVHQY